MKTKTKTLTDAQHNEAIRRAHKRYHDAIDAALGAGLQVRAGDGSVGLNGLTGKDGDTTTVRRPALTVTRTFA